MKTKLIVLAISSLAILASCTGKKTTPNAADNDSANVVDTTASNKDNVDLTSVAGTYEGTLPAADCPGIKTVLTINTDSTYLLKQDYIDKKDGHDEASGIFKVLDGKVLMLVRPSTGEQTFYKVKNANSIIMTDSMGVEPEGETAKLYVLKRNSTQESKKRGQTIKSIHVFSIYGLSSFKSTKGVIYLRYISCRRLY